MKGCTHKWRWISDWYGDPGVINGTADCSRWECQHCGSVDQYRARPSANDVTSSLTEDEMASIQEQLNEV
jgi:hypothetical protein